MRFRIRGTHRFWYPARKSKRWIDGSSVAETYHAYAAAEVPVRTRQKSMRAQSRWLIAFSAILVSPPGQA